ncbi:MAG TPA: HAMP domain-containing sensor histidine kinase [Polyangiales bacterium]
MNRVRSLSIVPSLITPPLPPKALRLRLLLVGYGVALALALFTLLGAPFVLALPGVDAEALLRLTAAQSAVVATVLLVITQRGMQRMSPIYDTLLRGPRDAPSEPGPPLPAVAAAFRFPERATWRTLACAQLVPLIDALGLVPISGLSGWARIAVDLLTMAVAAAGSMPSIVLYRRIIWRWLGRLNPRDVPLATNGHLPQRLALTVAVPVGVVGTAAVVVLSSHLVALRARVLPPIQMGALSVELDLAAAMLALGLIIATTALAYSLARQLGNELSHDVTSIRRQIERVQHGYGPPSSSPILFRSLAHTPAGRKLALALTDLAARFAQMREKEREGRLAMEQAQRLRTQFLASMSHDLRSPLNSLLGFATLIASGVEGPISPEQRESIQMITRSARDLLRLITNILDSARLEAGRLTFDRRWVPAGEILAQALNDGRRMLEDRPQLEIEAELEAALPAVFVDQERVVQAIVGLFTHAIHATDRGTIKLKAFVYGGTELRVEVSDQGAGIREADQATLFEAFRELQEPSGRRIGGLGLGLSLARELVRANGGDIWFSSRHGVGTTFTVALPIQRPT